MSLSQRELGLPSFSSLRRARLPRTAHTRATSSVNSSTRAACSERRRGCCTRNDVSMPMQEVNYLLRPARDCGDGPRTTSGKRSTRDGFRAAAGARVLRLARSARKKKRKRRPLRNPRKTRALSRSHTRRERCIGPRTDGAPFRSSLLTATRPEEPAAGR